MGLFRLSRINLYVFLLAERSYSFTVYTSSGDLPSTGGPLTARNSLSLEPAVDQGAAQHLPDLILFDDRGTSPYVEAAGDESELVLVHIVCDDASVPALDWALGHLPRIYELRRDTLIEVLVSVDVTGVRHAPHFHRQLTSVAHPSTHARTHSEAEDFETTLMNGIRGEASRRNDGLASFRTVRLTGPIILALPEVCRRAKSAIPDSIDLVWCVRDSGPPDDDRLRLERLLPSCGRFLLKGQGLDAMLMRVQQVSWCSCKISYHRHPELICYHKQDPFPQHADGWIADLRESPPDWPLTIGQQRELKEVGVVGVVL